METQETFTLRKHNLQKRERERHARAHTHTHTHTHKRLNLNTSIGEGPFDAGSLHRKPNLIYSHAQWCNQATPTQNLHIQPV
jgi:hypothetical protein